MLIPVRSFYPIPLVAIHKEDFHSFRGYYISG